MMQPDAKIQTPDLALPKGGGAMKGIGETFQPNIFKGTGSYSIPIPVTSARGFEPELSLTYHSAEGNSPFGLGFSLNLPKISIRTDRGIPKYDGSDVYLLSGSELVPKKRKSNPSDKGETYTEYYPRVEGDFTRIRQYKVGNASYWELISSENVTSIFGQQEKARVADPDNSHHIFEWLLESATDAKGNKIRFHYQQADDKGTADHGYENKRSNAQRYIRSIQYGNHKAGGDEQFAFEVVFDYGAHDLSQLTRGGSDPYQPTKEWKYRQDAYSSYRSGFEIRTRRLCQNILLFHHFEQELGEPSLVKRLQLQYESESNYGTRKIKAPSRLTSVQLTGYKRPGRKSTDPYEAKSLPPVSFSYSTFKAPDQYDFKPLLLKDGDATRPIPDYLDASGFQPIDLYGEGIAGLLYTKGSSLLYCRPLGNGVFEEPHEPTSFPVDRDFENSTAALVDLEGNGELALTVNKSDRNGFYARKVDQSWADFQHFDQYPTDHAHPAIERVGLGANGKTDLLMVDGQQLYVYPSQGKKGFEQRQVIDRTAEFPVLKNNYPEEHVSFGNLLGDGLSHRIRITRNSVACWPSLGYGHFGEKINLQFNADLGETFDSSRLFLADIDGSGTLDLAYVQQKQIDIYFNENGNGFSDPLSIELPQEYSDLDQISFADILGNGTSSLVFSKIGTNPQHLFYNFARAITPDSQTKTHITADKGLSTVESVTTYEKPHLLSRIDNHLGGTTELHYTSSTNFYLQDKANDDTWKSTIPFPVQVVEKVVTREIHTRMRLSQSYAYHDGYYDHQERAFQGFGVVESWDTEAQVQGDASNHGASYFAAPVYTKTWHYTGAEVDYQQQQHGNGAFYQKDTKAYSCPTPVFPLGMTDQEKRQSFTALNGAVQRTEVYALDDTDQKIHPFTVSQANVEVQLLQHKEQREHAVFMVLPRESIEYHYERNPEDPRISQSFTLTTDAYGNVLTSCELMLPRRGIVQSNEGILKEQKITQGLITHQRYVAPLKDTKVFCHQPCEQQTLELVNLPSASEQYYHFTKIAEVVRDALTEVVPYGQEIKDDDGIKARQLSWHRTYYWNDQAQAMHQWSKIGKEGLVHHHEEAVFTDAWIHAIFKNKVEIDQVAKAYGGYSFDQDNSYWWNKGLEQHYSPQQYYQPVVTQSPADLPKELFSQTTISYDAYALYPTRSAQYVDDSTLLEQELQYNYRVGEVQSIKDPNQNTSQALFDPLGQVIVTSRFGTEQGKKAGGMTLLPEGQVGNDHYQPVKDPSLSKLLVSPKEFLQGASTYFFYDFPSDQPQVALTLTREKHHHQDATFDASHVQIALGYADGLGQSLAEKLRVDEDGVIPIRWQTSGDKVYNNKGNVVEEYLPYFSNTSDYESKRSPIEVVPPTITHYDPLQRAIRVDTPKGYFTRVVFSPWQEAHYDENDTVKNSNRYEKRREFSLEEQQALKQAESHHDTPEIKILDSKGQVCRVINQIKTGGEKLIEYYETDLLGRNTLSIDARLYRANQQKPGPNYNFRYHYAMDSGEEDEEGEVVHSPMLTDSTDGGKQYHFSNIYGQQLLSWSPRNFCQLIGYDHLQRQSTLRVKEIAKGPVKLSDFASFPLLEQYTYGDPAAGADDNVRGQLIQVKDLSGIVTYPQYTFEGQVQQTTRQMLKEHKYGKKKYVADWAAKPAPKLESKTYTQQYQYNALEQIILETAPDGSQTSTAYNQAGQTYRIEVQLPDQARQPIVESISYDANDQRTQITFANGIRTTYQYEPTTLRLTRLTSKLNGKALKQDISYTYDPVGNITQLHDRAYDPVFHGGQIVEPISKYTYDALYRLTQATGREHPGLSAPHQGAAPYMSYMQGGAKAIRDEKALENYTETYTYDLAGNLIEKQHQTRQRSTTAVEKSNNRLADLPYDDAGNLLKPHGKLGTQLSYNCCENLVKATTIQRAKDTADDCEYYDYDRDEQRTRKVTDHQGQSLEEKVYLGNYEVKRKKNKTTQETTYERNTLRVMDGDRCLAIIYTVVTENSKPVQSTTPQVRYQLTNHLDSVSMELSASAKLISYEEYLPYGGTAIQLGPEVSSKEYRYAGKERDETTGLYYYGYRYYAPWLGRWLKPDPAGTVDGLNVYAFVGGNPVGSVDVGGLMISKKLFKRLPQIGRMEGAFLYVMGVSPLNLAALNFKRSKHENKRTIEGDGFKMINQTEETYPSSSEEINEEISTNIVSNILQFVPKKKDEEEENAAEEHIDALKPMKIITEEQEKAGEELIDSVRSMNIITEEKLKELLEDNEPNDNLISRIKDLVKRSFRLHVIYNIPTIDEMSYQ